MLADRGGAGAALAPRLEADGHRCEVISPGDVDARRPPDSLAGGPDVRTEREPIGVVHLWGLDTPTLEEADAAKPVEEQWRVTGSALTAVQTLVAEQVAVGRLVVVTRGAQRTARESHRRPDPGAVWGLARVIRSEHPSLPIACVDLDPEPEADERPPSRRRCSAAIARTRLRSAAASAWWRAWSSPVARARRRGRRRQGGRGDPPRDRRARIARQPALGAGEADSARAGPGGDRGPDQRTQLPRRPQHPWHVPGDAGALGSECAGYVCSVGEGVDDLRVGDPVLTLTNPAFATYVTAEAALVVRKPDAMTMAEAATIPVTFLTAAYGPLHELGRIKAGERVLIHAGAGGVGLAAVQIARRAGAEIFATAGSAAKREPISPVLGVRTSWTRAPCASRTR